MGKSFASLPCVYVLEVTERKHLQSSDTGNLFNHKKIKAYVTLQHLLIFWFLHVALSAFLVRKKGRVKEERRIGREK